MKLVFEARLFLKEPDELPVYVERLVHREADLPPLHEHEFYELVYIVHGHAVHYFENKAYPLRGGDLLFIRPGQFHTYMLESNGSIELINCLFLQRLFDPLWRQAIDPGNSIEAFLLYPFLGRAEEFHPRISLELADARRVERLLEEMLEEQARRRQQHAAILKLKMFELFQLMIRYQNEAIHRAQAASGQHADMRAIMIRRVHQFLAENAEQKHDMNRLAHYYGISSRHLNRLFKQDTGMTIVEMLHYIRIENAKQLLLHTNDRIIDIATKVGYDDTSFFTKLFIRKVKCSPGQYRALMQRPTNT